MYYIYYGDKVLHDPYSSDYEYIYNARTTGGLNDRGTFDFTIAPNHPLYSVIAQREQEVKLYYDDKVIFSGYISSIEMGFEKEKQIQVDGDLGYLNDVYLRPYTTNDIPTEETTVSLLRAPSDPSLLFEWYVSQYNDKASRMFNVGVNQIGALVTGGGLNIESSSMTTVASEIEDKLINGVGGYMYFRYDEKLNIRYIDYYSDVSEINSQIIDFGVNLMDYSKTESEENLYTAVIPVGKDGLTIKNYGDNYYGNYLVRSDVMINQSAAEKYGYKEYLLEYPEVEDFNTLLALGSIYLAKVSKPDSSVSIKAVDLSLYMNEYQHLKVGEIVRIRSYPHDIDEYMVVQEMNLDLDNPENTEFTLGVVYNNLTGETSKKLTELNSSINKTADEVGSISQESKESAEKANEALSKADEVYDKADKAEKNASDALEKADKAVISTEEEFYQSESPEELIGGEWKTKSPKWTEGTYIWRRTLVTYGDGTTEYTPNEDGICITGNTGEEGPAGEDGEPGAPGEDGKDGLTSYFHVAYADSSDGKKGFSIDDSENKSYIGQYTDFIKDPSNNPEDYSWTLIKGEDGESGKDGSDGKMLTGTSGSYADVASKYVGNVEGFKLIAGTTVAITFENANTAANPTLSINGTGYKPIITNGVNYAYWVAGQTVLFVYDGSVYQVASTDVYANTTTIGNPAEQNVYIDNDSVDIRNGNIVNASFSETSIELGKNSLESEIYMCDNVCSILGYHNPLDKVTYLSLHADDPEHNTYLQLMAKNSVYISGKSYSNAPVISLSAHPEEGGIPTQLQLYSKQIYFNNVPGGVFLENYLIPKFYKGSKVIDMGNNGNWCTLFTSSEYSSITGHTLSNSSTRDYIFIDNGDDTAYSGVMSLSVHPNGYAYVQLNNNKTGLIRINYVIVTFTY